MPISGVAMHKLWRAGPSASPHLSAPPTPSLEVGPLNPARGSGGAL